MSSQWNDTLLQNVFSYRMCSLTECVLLYCDMSSQWNDTLFIVLSGFLQVFDRKRNKLFVLDKGDRYACMRISVCICVRCYVCVVYII